MTDTPEKSLAEILTDRLRYRIGVAETELLRREDELRAQNERERKGQERITTDLLHQRAQGMVARWTERLQLKVSTWVAQNRTTATPTVHTRAFYAEHLLESATLCTQLSRKAASLIDSDQDATNTMRDWEEEAAHLAMLSMLMLERQRMITAEKVAKRMTEGRRV